MRTKLMILAVLTTVVVRIGSAQDVSATLGTAELALGMIRTTAKVDRLIAVQYDGTATMIVSGRAVAVPRYRAGTRYDLEAMRVDFDLPAGPQSQRQIEVVAGALAWNEAGMPGGSASPAAAGAVPGRLLQLWMTPHGAIKAARRAGAQAKVTAEGGLSVITFPLPAPLAGTTMKVTLNDKSLPARVEARTGAVVIDAAYTDYRNWDLNGVMFPARIVHKLDGQPLLDLTVTRCRCNNPYVVFPVPDNVERTAAR